MTAASRPACASFTCSAPTLALISSLGVSLYISFSFGPEFFELLVRLGVFGLVAKINGNRVADASRVGLLEAFDHLFRHREGEGEGHLVIGRHSEDPVPVARKDHLRLAGLLPLDHDVGAVAAAGEIALEATSLFIEVGIEEAQHLGGIPVDKNGVGSKVRAS